MMTGGFHTCCLAFILYQTPNCLFFFSFSRLRQRANNGCDRVTPPWHLILPLSFVEVRVGSPTVLIFPLDYTIRYRRFISFCKIVIVFMRNMCTENSDVYTADFFAFPVFISVTNNSRSCKQFAVDLKLFD